MLGTQISNDSFLDLRSPRLMANRKWLQDCMQFSDVSNKRKRHQSTQSVHRSRGAMDEIVREHVRLSQGILRNYAQWRWKQNFGGHARDMF